MAELTKSELLVKHGFIQSGHRGKYVKKDDGTYRRKEGSIDGSHADEEVTEDYNVGHVGEYLPTGFPSPEKRYKLMQEGPNVALEDIYYWITNHLQTDWGFPHADKITDIFSASESSSFWGHMQQRRKIQEDQATQYLATIGKMTKELFKIVREVRILKERLSHYEADTKSADITLKGYWIDQVEGGGKSPSSVYGLANKVGFETLPDLFFSIKVDDPKKVDKLVEQEASGYNRKVKEVLKRKLRQFSTWKKETYKELKTRKKFTLKYLRQHWTVIEMYMDWLKPYLKNVRKLSMRSTKGEQSTDLVSAFESALMEIEVLFYMPEMKGYHPVVLAHFDFRTKPAMNYSQEGRQRGPQHTGRASMELRAYAWTEEDIDSYKRMRKEEDRQLISHIDKSIKESMNALGDEIEEYLTEAEDLLEKEEGEEGRSDKQKKSFQTTYGALEPFIETLKGFKEIGSNLLPAKSFLPSGTKGSGGTPKKAAGKAKLAAYQTYKNFKKSRGFYTW